MPNNRKLEPLGATSDSTPDSSTPSIMRTLALIGTLLFLTGASLFTRGTGWQSGYSISGTILGLLGLLILGLTASNSGSDAPTRGPKPRNRIPRRSTTSIRSLRTRRVVITGAGR